mmetsp:Transcript_17639/g.55228  ORF Transcript_17639/g.55228 Transcript_17639/m.55228 type:complete len:293 (-) Transcript_17639:1238-2116(-)
MSVAPNLVAALDVEDVEGQRFHCHERVPQPADLRPRRRRPRRRGRGRGRGRGGAASLRADQGLRRRLVGILDRGALVLGAGAAALARLRLAQLLHEDRRGLLVLWPRPSDVVLVEERRANDPQGPGSGHLVQRHEGGHAEGLAGEECLHGNPAQRRPQVKPVVLVEVLVHLLRDLAQHALGLVCRRRCHQRLIVVLLEQGPLPPALPLPGRDDQARQLHLHDVGPAGQGHVLPAEVQLHRGQRLQVRAVVPDAGPPRDLLQRLERPGNDVGARVNDGHALAFGAQGEAAARL